MATGTTPLRLRPYPLETDAPDVAADMHALALNLDTVPSLTSGTTLPVSGMVAGDEFQNSTTKVWYKYDGTSWQAMSLGDTGWISLTLPTGFTTLISPSARYRQVGHFVYLDGYFQSNSSWTASASFANAPFGAGSWQLTDAGHTVTVTSSTRLSVSGFTGASQGVFLSSLFYPID